MLTDNNIIQEQKACIQCGAVTELQFRFCKNCGAPQSAEIVHLGEKWGILKQVIAFYLIDIIACILSKFVPAFDTFSWALFFDIAMAVITVAFFAYNWTGNKAIFNWKTFSWQKLATYCGIAVAASLIVHYSISWLNITIYSNDDHYYAYLRGNLWGEFLLIFFVAVMPAIFEELGYRGYLLQALLKVVDKEQAIYISAFLFAIIHFSFISLFWLIPFALLLGYTRIRENTIWYGIFMHFTFNLVSCLLGIFYVANR